MKKNLKSIFKRHIALVILIVILLVFPVSLSNQAKLNMRIIVTGIAIDKKENDYEVTAQVVKPSPGMEAPGTSATIDFISETAPTVSLALSKLMYKAGKVSAFSHTNFVLVSKEIAEKEGAKCLDIFVRDKIIRNSAMVLFSEGKASDEMKKTKDLELSVGFGIQKVFLFKQGESDGVMTTVLDFLNDSKLYSKTAAASVLQLGSDDETKQDSGSSKSETGGQTGQGSSGGSGGSGSSSGGSGSGGGTSGSSSSSGSGSGSTSSGGSGGGSSGGSEQSSAMFFKGKAPVYLFVDSKLAVELKEEDELNGFMLSNKKSKQIDLALEEFENEKLKGAKITIAIKNKTQKLKVRFEEEIPCIDVSVNINDSEIIEIISDQNLIDLDDDEYKSIEEALKKKIKESISKAFEKTQSKNADMLGAYELAYKYKNKIAEKYYPNPEEFLKYLKLNVSVKVNKLEY